MNVWLVSLVASIVVLFYARLRFEQKMDRYRSGSAQRQELQSFRRSGAGYIGLYVLSFCWLIVSALGLMVSVSM